MAILKCLRVRGVRHSFGSMAGATAGAVLVISSSILTCRAGDVSKTEADRLIAAAATAETGGDTGKSRILFQDAAKDEPDAQLADWQLGQVQVDGKWIAADEAQRRAAADPLQSEYRLRARTARHG